jgi:hypothetical protein
VEPDDVVDLALGHGPVPDDTLAGLGLDSLDVLEVLAGLEVACPGLSIADDPPLVALSPSRLRSIVGAYRNLGASAMTVVVEVP